MTTYYVSSTGGNDANAGTSSGAAFATLQTAANHLHAGDSVEVGSGTYSVTPNGGSVMYLGASGTASAPITVEAAAGAHPVIDSSGESSGIRVVGSYITVSGFEVKGSEQAVNANSPDDWYRNGTGIIIQGASSSSPATHDVIKNNTIHDESLQGIGVETYTDYVSILNNTAYNNAYYSPSGGSGISVYELVNSDGNTGTKNFIEGNTTYGNKELVNSTDIGQNYITDGNGIIIDSGNNVGYSGATLVANNLSYNNGGSGLHSFASSNVSFEYNTTYGNEQTPSLAGHGQIFSYSGSNNVVANNILDGAAGGSVDSSNDNTRFANNLVTGSGYNVKGAGDIVADPAFVNPGASDFHLQSGSPAIGAASSAYSVPTDITGASRPSSGATIGAYQYAGSPPPPPPPPPPSGSDTLTVRLSEDAWQGDAQATISIDGNTLTGQPVTVTAPHSQGQSQALTFNGTFGAGPHTVGVSFLNDAYGGTSTADRNLYVDGVTLNGAPSPALAGGSVGLFSAGTKQFYVGPDTAVLHLSEDAWQGDAQFTASLDGKPLNGGTPQTVTASHSAGQTQDFTYTGAFGPGPHDLAVTFTNDAYGGSSTADRNLFVNGVTYDTTNLSGASANLWNAGTAHFQVPALTGLH